MYILQKPTQTYLRSSGDSEYTLVITGRLFLLEELEATKKEIKKKAILKQSSSDTNIKALFTYQLVIRWKIQKPGQRVALQTVENQSTLVTLLNLDLIQFIIACKKKTYFSFMKPLCQCLILPGEFSQSLLFLMLSFLLFLEKKSSNVATLRNTN